MSNTILNCFVVDDSSIQRLAIVKMIEGHPNLKLIGEFSNAVETKTALKEQVVELSEQTREDNLRFFDSINDVPKQAITMGLGTIMESKKVVLMANGEHKKDILDIAMNGEITKEVPASILQNHDNVKVYYCD